uniref:Uncharacterized protein n=1 Tax=Romanomermis culicivorax TaxID=13658 RepID=A0A915HQ74_ROMCU
MNDEECDFRRMVIPEGFNYGLFLPPCNGRAGKFLVDDRIFRDYPFNDCPPYLELKYKKRVYKSFNIDTKVYKRLHSKHSLKRFFDLCEKREAKKVESLCQIGLDPNFHGIHG